MKSVALAAFDRQYAYYMKSSLTSIFGKRANFRCYDLNELKELKSIEADCVFVSSFRSFQLIRNKVGAEIEVIQSDRDLNKETMSELYKIPEGSKALLVNIDYINCMEVAEAIYSAGFSNLELIPYYPGCEYDKDIRIAITPGEVSVIPDTVTTVFDIGQRLVDRSSIYRLAKCLDALDVLDTEEVKKELDKRLNSNPEMERLLDENSDLYIQISAILKMIKSGMIITDRKGKIRLMNDMARDVLGYRDEDIKGFSLMEVFPQFYTAKEGIFGEKTMEKLIRIDDKDVIASFSKIDDSGEIRGTIVMLERFSEAESRQHKMRKKLRETGHTASYTFNQILGISPEIREAKKIAMRMAKSDSSICISGESGTGKELFAQSIHNYSERRDYLFVAINCSALPENLLESELYGYEEGAFSGASKGGKIGLFELAHKGTLFLDEVGELPMLMQAKLLRAIEERKILRVGGRNMIDVDVRIICATNRDLKKMVREGKFREDLYYRLSVLPIGIPPLRKRKGDILYLFEQMKRDIHADFVFSEEARQYILQYDWPGNVRELRNLTEYLYNLGKAIVSKEDLPIVSSDLFRAEKNESLYGVDKKTLKYFLLKEIARSQDNRIHIGRIQLLRKAETAGIFATEQEIRTAVSDLNSEGLVVSFRGRKGSMITEKGRKMLTKIGEEMV